MGAIEKQARRVLETESIPRYEGDIRGMAPNAKTRIEIDWESLGDDREAWMCLSSAPQSAIYNIALGSTVWTLEELCHDDVYREAVAEGLAAIRVVHRRDQGRGAASFDNGVLTLTVDATKEGAPDCDDVKALLVNAL